MRNTVKGVYFDKIVEYTKFYMKKGGFYMQRSSLPVGISTLKKWKEDMEILHDNLPFQRHSGMWSSIVQSNLIWAILADSYIPPIVLLKDKVGEGKKGKDVFNYSILDGLQRLTTIFSFINGEFLLHSATEDVEIDDEVYELSGLSYEELSDVCKDRIQGYRFSVQCLENYTMEEAEKLFYNINSGVALSSVQRSKSKMGTEMISFLNELLRGNFFTQAINITERQARAEDDLLCLLQGLILQDNIESGYVYKNISTGTCLNYAASLRNNYGDSHKSDLACLVHYLDEAFPQKHKFLRKNNVPIVLVIAGKAMEQDVSPEDFRKFINGFANEVNPLYEEASGSGNVKAVKVQMRLRIMFLAMCEYFDFSAGQIGKPFADDIPLYIPEIENFEDNQDIPSPVASLESDAENQTDETEEETISDIAEDHEIGEAPEEEEETEENSDAESDEDTSPGETDFDEEGLDEADEEEPDQEAEVGTDILADVRDFEEEQSEAV